MEFHRSRSVVNVISGEDQRAKIKDQRSSRYYSVTATLRVLVPVPPVKMLMRLSPGQITIAFSEFLLPLHPSTNEAFLSGNEDDSGGGDDVIVYDVTQDGELEIILSMIIC